MPFFAINADDTKRAAAFYEQVFGWAFEKTQWGDFYLINMGGQHVGALEARHELIEGWRTNAFRLTFGVDDIRATLAAVAAQGGQVLMQPSPTGESDRLVGYFEDGEGNISGVSQTPGPRHPGAPSQFRYFAINANDVQRAKAFYENVFGWKFSPWGPPDYYQVMDVWPGKFAALQERRDLISGVRTNACETTFAVDDIRAALATAAAAGGKVLMPPYRIEGVGEVGYFQDTEGNICGVAEYVAGYWK